MKNITITYTADIQNNKIVIIDDESHGSQINTVGFTGKTGKSIAWQVTIPENYDLAAGGKISGNYTFNAVNQIPIEVHVRHKHVQDDESKSVTRTIVTNLPG